MIRSLIQLVKDHNKILNIIITFITTDFDSTTKFQIDADETSTIEWATEAYVRRGDKITFYQNNNNNDERL